MRKQAWVVCLGLGLGLGLVGANAAWPVRDRLSADHAQLLREMWRTRREEGFADLVGLAWTLQHHPDHYQAVHAWHVMLRAQQLWHDGLQEAAAEP